jgi:hypothetical protein
MRKVIDSSYGTVYYNSSVKNMKAKPDRREALKFCMEYLKKHKGRS